MNKMAPAALAAAIALVSVGTAFAQDNNAASQKAQSKPYYTSPIKPNHFDSPMFDADNWDGFFSGSHLRVWLRAAYANIDWKHANKSAGALKGSSHPDLHQLGLGGMIDWMSGYIDGWFGINASLYGAQKLDYSGASLGGWLLQKNNGEMADNYGRIGRLNAKFRLGNSINNVLIHAGYVGLDSEYLNSELFAKEPHKITLTTMRGVTVKSNLHDLQLYGAYMDRIAQRASNGMTHFVDDHGKSIQYIGMVGADYHFTITDRQKLDLNAEFAKGQNYDKEYYGRATYSMDFNSQDNMIVDGRYYATQKDGSGFDNAAMKDDGHLSNISATFNLSHLMLTAGFANAEAKNNTKTGLDSNHFYYSPAANYTPGVGYSTSRIESDFDFDGENAYQAGVGYDFSDFAPGLSAQLVETYGNNISNRVGLASESETDLMVNYDIPGVKGLNLDLEDAYYNTVSKDTSYVPNSTNGQRYNDLRAWLNYKIVAF